MFILEKKPKSLAAEAYRTLRTNIEYSEFDKEVKTILVTSSGIKEGKSTVAGNMALSFAENDKNVLLIDCDLRNPSIHTMFNISSTYGLSDLLSGSKKLDEVIRHYNNKLDIIPCGNLAFNPAKMIESSTMNNLLESLKKFYDVIILDSSPINIVTDAQLLSTKVDGTILIARKGSTKLEDIRESKKLLDKVGANIIGCIFNGVDDPIKKEYSYYLKKSLVKA